jgi:hypothetical protein
MATVGVILFALIGAAGRLLDRVSDAALTKIIDNR